MNNTQLSGRAPSGRALTLDTFRTLLGLMTTPEGIQRGLGIRLRPSDTVVTPFGKSGTTWLQQIAHTLRTRGDMDFDDISRVVPWIETSTDLGLDLDAEQRAHPRIFKSHLDAYRVPAGGRYINCCRNPVDVLYSMYRFMEGWFLEPGAVSPDEFALGTFIKTGAAPGNQGGDYWTHLRSWWARREDPDVLFLVFEHMKNDLPGTIRRVAAFMEIELDDELLAITAEHASLEFMQRHIDRFDDKLMRERSVAVAGLPGDSESSKVRTGQVGDARQQFSPAVVAALDAVWHERITKELGFENYEEMISTLDRE
jgi:hypothetical protein